MYKFVLLALIALFLGTYEKFFLIIYDEKTANFYIDIVFVPIIVIVFLVVTIKGLIKDIRNKQMYWVQFIKDAGLFVLTVSVIYYVFVRTVFSGFILFANKTFDFSEKTIMVSGEIVKKNPRYDDSESLNYELVLKDKNLGWLTLDVSYSIFEEVQVGAEFKEEMQVGLFGIVYK